MRIGIDIWSINLHISNYDNKDEKLVNKLKKEIELNFKPFELEFDELVLYDYPGD